MSNPLKMVSRLFKKNPSSIMLAELHSKMAQPLFMHPHLGKVLIRSYIDAANMMPVAAVEREGPQSHSGVAVVDISGALVAHEMSVPCGTAPVSYEGLHQEMQQLLDDPSVTTIIGRFDTPGGMAAQNMDLSDFIYSSRGLGTRLVAMVDDMAYSAGYSIASAFDEIWVTRTSGVGSVGVVSYHDDHSVADKKAGVETTYIYAGDKKIDGNPGEQLSDGARLDRQNEVNRLYNLFVATVARNLNLAPAAIIATQAGTFHGEEAVAAGFAHKVGTFNDLLVSLMQDDAQPATSAALKVESAEAALEAEAAGAALEAEAAEKIKLEAERVRGATIKAICAAADRPAAAEHFIDAGTSAESVSDEMLKLTSTPDTGIGGDVEIAAILPDSDAETWVKALKAARPSTK